MTYWFKIYLNLIFCLSIFSVSMAQVQTLTLDDCLKIAEENNPQIIQSELAIKQSQEKQKEINAAFYPQVEFDLSIIQRNEAQYFRINSGSVQDIVAKTARDKLFTSALEINQLITDFGSINHRVKAEEFDQKALKANSEDRRLKVYSKIKQLFYQTLANLKIDSIYQESVKRNELLKYIAIEKVIAGAALPTDSLSAIVNLQNAKFKQIEAQNNWKKSLVDLIGLLGIETQIIKLKGHLPELKEEILNIDVHSINLGETLKYRQDYLQISQLLNKQQELIASVQSTYFPKIYLKGNIAYNAPNLRNQYWNSNDLGLKTYSGFIGLNIEFSLYNGGTTTAQKNLYQIQENIISEAQRNLKLQINNQIISSIRDIKTYWAAYQSSKISNKTAEKMFEQIQFNYKNGAASMLEYTEAINTMADTQVYLVQNKIKLIDAIIELERLSGDLKYKI